MSAWVSDTRSWLELMKFIPTTVLINFHRRLTYHTRYWACWGYVKSSNPLIAT